MADRDETVMGEIAHQISVTYSNLVDVCMVLPVPITLPIGEELVGTVVVPAIRRVVDLAPDQPMGNHQRAQLHTGCIHLLAAMDLYALCAAGYHYTRAEAVAANLLYGNESLMNLHVWLLTQN